MASEPPYYLVNKLSNIGTLLYRISVFCFITGLCFSTWRVFSTSRIFGNIPALLDITVLGYLRSFLLV